MEMNKVIIGAFRTETENIEVVINDKDEDLLYGSIVAMMEDVALSKCGDNKLIALAILRGMHETAVESIKGRFGTDKTGG